MRKKAAELLLDQIDRSALPDHIAIIMDGNGRWARKRGLPRVAGHRAGIGSVREVVEGSAELGISVLTLYAFSVENWKRPETEVRTLMSLLKEYLGRELESLLRNNIRFRGCAPSRPIPRLGWLAIICAARHIHRCDVRDSTGRDTLSFC